METQYFQKIPGGLLAEHHLHQFRANASGLTVSCGYVYGDGIPCMTAVNVALGTPQFSWGYRVYRREEQDPGATAYTRKPYSGGSSIEPPGPPSESRHPECPINCRVHRENPQPHLTYQLSELLPVNPIDPDVFLGDTPERRAYERWRELNR